MLIVCMVCSVEWVDFFVFVIWFGVFSVLVNLCSWLVGYVCVLVVEIVVCGVILVGVVVLVVVDVVVVVFVVLFGVCVVLFVWLFKRFFMFII